MQSHARSPLYTSAGLSGPICGMLGVGWADVVTCAGINATHACTDARFSGDPLRRGYRDPNAFQRSFRKWTGMSPQAPHSQRSD